MTNTYPSLDQVAQGDTLITKISDDLNNFDKFLTQFITATITPKEIGLDEYGIKTVVRGEHTGHHHAFKDSNVQIYQINDQSSVLQKFLIRVEAATEYHHVKAPLNKTPVNDANGDVIDMWDHHKVSNFLHEDLHAPHMINPGIYILTTQQQVDIDGLIRPVVD